MCCNSGGNANPGAVFDALVQHAASRAAAVKGFSVIAGDFNFGITSHPNWVRLQRLGGQDMAVLSGKIHGDALDNTEEFHLKQCRCASCVDGVSDKLIAPLFRHIPFVCS